MARGVLVLRKRNVALFTSITVCVICLAILFTFLNPLRYFRSLVVFANPAPPVIPSLREWTGGSGSFVLTRTSRIVIDPVDQTELMETARVFQGDLFEVVARTLPITVTGSPKTGDFLLTLNTADDGIGTEGYLFDVGDWATISATTSRGIFYGTRTALQILRGGSFKELYAQGKSQGLSGVSRARLSARCRAEVLLHWVPGRRSALDGLVQNE
jgi:hexosaminidase